MSFWERLHGRLFPNAKSVRVLPALESSRFQFGARAMVLKTEATDAAGLSGRIGVVFGQTTPSSSGVTVIGELLADYAVNLSFESPPGSYWFAEHLLELVEEAPEMQIEISEKDGKPFISVRTVDKGAPP